MLAILEKTGGGGYRYLSLLVTFLRLSMQKYLRLTPCQLSR